MSQPLSRRRLLQLGGLGAATAALAACGTRGQSGDGWLTARGTQQADDVTGPFSWRRAEGHTVRLLLTAHHYTDALLADLAEFTRLTGIRVTHRVLPEETYFDQVTVDLLGGSSGADVFMTGAYMLWQYAPPGWLEDLTPWLRNPAATWSGYDFEDIYPNLRAANQWDGIKASPLGHGGQWAIPWGWETNIVAYQADLFARLGLRPPEHLDGLVDTAAALTRGLRRAGHDDAFGIAVRGTRSWATIHPGFMTQLVREGGHDFVSSGGRLVPAMGSTTSVAFHERWMGMVRESGPSTWSSYTYQDCAKALGDRRAGMVYDATSITTPVNQGRTAVAGHVAWYPGPTGPTGSLQTNLWVWSLAMNSRSPDKLAAWLFLQWATGRQHLLTAAVHHHHSDPVRVSVAEAPAYRRRMGVHRGYLDAVAAVRASTHVQFTPQRHFFDAATSWAGALQDIHAGQPVRDRLQQLSTELAARV